MIEFSHYEVQHFNSRTETWEPALKCQGFASPPARFGTLKDARERVKNYKGGRATRIVEVRQEKHCVLFQHAESSKERALSLLREAAKVMGKTEKTLDADDRCRIYNKVCGAIYEIRVGWKPEKE